ncbi:arylamine N-acetyltransferase [Actinomycetospora lutea]|uniref:arylamine N-acetyltransferase family protein n=1 Tax=Actinomycetospora lutea TaxID=663604 RepID=UPI002366AA7F|nr:arylamine N-acetyltransferase [Actinomycetospora lutea]MDD7941696.1 arylamine N-acetyltransferase [Actinomycetospora lutea]
MDATAYLARIGAGADDPLDALMARHLETVPFENLSVHQRDRVPLEDPALVEKIVDRRRGGFCYELNGAFAWLLGALGREVWRCSARVATDDGFSFPGDHMALVVDRTTLVDVGFGRFAVGPIDLDSRDEQPDRAGVFTVRDAPDGEFDIVWDGRTQYRLDPRPRSLADFVPMAWWHRTSPTSPFTQALLASRLTPTARVTISGDLFIETPDDGERTEKKLPVDEQLATYRDTFGIVLDAVPPALCPPD